MRCRPTNFDWQGKIVKTEDFINITRYGEVDGIYGINCGHYAEAYFGDARGNELKTISKGDATNAYNLSQKQRYLERGVRKWERKAEMYKANEDTEYYEKCQDKVKEWQLRTKEFTEKNKLNRDYTREYVGKAENVTPSFIGYKSKGVYSEQEIVKLANEVKNMSDKYIEKPSKWSGNIVINNSRSSGKMWNCDITTRNNTSAHELLHEILHSKSISYYDADTFFNNVAYEEIPVQFMTQEISFKEGIDLVPSKYDFFVDELRKINEDVKIEESNYLFAKKLFNIEPAKRYDWLLKQVKYEPAAVEILEKIRDDEYWKKWSKN